MAALNYIVYFSNNGLPVTGLTPTWQYFNSVSTNSPISSPSITELDHGCYKFSYDVIASGEVRGRIDGGASIANPGNRFVTGVVSDADPLRTTDVTAIISGILTTQLTESYASLHSVPTLTQLLVEIRALLAESTVSGATITTKKLDGSTTAHTYTLDSGSAPTTITTAS